MANQVPAYILNVMAVDFDSVLSIKDEAIKAVFLKLEAARLKNFLGLSYHEIYPKEIQDLYANAFISADGKITITVNSQLLTIDKDWWKINFVEHGDIISFQENDARTRGEKIIGKFLDRPVRMWRRTKTEWFRKFKTLKGCRLLLKSQFLQQLRSSMQEEDTKKFGSKKVCLGSYFDEHNRMKRNLYHFKSLFLSKRRNEKNKNISTRTRNPIVYNSSLYSNSTYCSASPHQFTMKRKIKRIELPTHYSEVNHRTPKAVVFYGPNIGHIPHDIRLKDPNLLLRSGNERGQNI
ncbi:small ribosomal subunit protein uS4m [Primulina eburnea]|uniref:small ribosomal subunit protein uS4m n=1 Tax=Primulina eburnea TaxID=1245227 RepID=UPI003C6BEF96